VRLAAGEERGLAACAGEVLDGGERRTELLAGPWPGLPEDGEEDPRRVIRLRLEEAGGLAVQPPVLVDERPRVLLLAPREEAVDEDAPLDELAGALRERALPYYLCPLRARVSSVTEA